MIDAQAGDTDPGVTRERLRMEFEGTVQGVGFRPYLFRLTRSLALKGWVANSGAGVSAEVEGSPGAIADLLRRLPAELPPLARLARLETRALEPCGYTSFHIRESLAAAPPRARVAPDVATCPDCLREVLDPANRRHLYPFTNCTNCGPRFSILLGLPYDRANTTMGDFALCEPCRAEYETPGDRRFHAQPTACAECGPRLSLLDAAGVNVAANHDALLGAAAALREGKILALKGLGGFQLLVDARNDDAIARLRARKHRPHKPFAIMLASLESAAEHCELSRRERAALGSPPAPIVLLRRRRRPSPGAAVSAVVAPGNPWLGVMLPCTPLHHLLLRALRLPVVATSGNLSDEPMLIDEALALERLGGIAEMYLVHDRPIARAVDDSVLRIVAGRELMLRRARGYAPLEVALPRSGPSVLALGGHLKAAIALGDTRRVIVGPHIGNLDTPRARRAFHRAIDTMSDLHSASPEAIACDSHPDYYSTRVARDLGPTVVPVQHHLAHVVACAAENGLEGRFLGIAWDGTGHGDDGTAWGSECLVVDGASWRRVAHLHPFRLPGGEKAITEPRRAALALAYAARGESVFDTVGALPLEPFAEVERVNLRSMLARNLNSPLTTSAGRLFDGVASLLGLVQVSSFEGQAAMALEFATEGAGVHSPYRIALEAPARPGAPWRLDWRGMISALLEDIAARRSVARLATAFHEALVAAIVDVADHVGEPRVVLSGGCFQNRYLTERALRRLREAGFEPHWHRQVPPNDGGLALGQVVWARQALNQEGTER